MAEGPALDAEALDLTATCRSVDSDGTGSNAAAGASARRSSSWMRFLCFSPEWIMSAIFERKTTFKTPKPTQSFT